MAAIALSGAFPTLARVVEKDIDFNLETFFEFGLQRMLDGLAVLIAGSTSLGVPGEGVGTLR
jgi:hypothetical protein